MHFTIAFSALALALSSHVFAAPLQVRQDSLTVADTFLFIAKTVGSNPNPDVLPDVNNWHFTPIHYGAGLNLGALSEPTGSNFNLSAPGYFQNGTSSVPGEQGYITAGLYSTTPYSLVLDMAHEANSSNPGAYTGLVEFNAGIGTNGLNVGTGKLVTSNYAPLSLWACPNIPVEGALAIAVEVSNRYADAPAGCWSIELYAQCAGPISDSNRVTFPAFSQSTCYLNASSVVV